MFKKIQAKKLYRLLCLSGNIISTTSIRNYNINFYYYLFYRFCRFYRFLSGFVYEINLHFYALKINKVMDKRHTYTYYAGNEIPGIKKHIQI